MRIAQVGSPQARQRVLGHKAFGSQVDKGACFRLIKRSSAKDASAQHGNVGHTLGFYPLFRLGRACPYARITLSLYQRERAHGRDICWPGIRRRLPLKRSHT